MTSAALDQSSSSLPGAVTVVVAVEIRLYREAIGRTIAVSPGLRFAGEASTALEFSDLVGACRADVALVDVTMIGALEAVRRVSATAPRTRMLALGLPRLEEDVLAVAESGVAGFIGADAGLMDLVSAVHKVMEGEAPCSGRIAATLLRRVAATTVERTLDAGLDELTVREREILELLDSGLSNKEIARHLVIGLATVKSHVHMILRKLAVERRGAAVARLHGPQ